MTDRTAHWLITLSAAILAAGCSPTSKGGNSIDPLITSISDLPEPQEKDIETPMGPTFPDPGVQCEVIRREYSHGSQTYPALAAHFDVVYPGADLQGQTLYGAIAAPITAPRGGGSIAISSLNGSLRSSVELEEVSLAKVNEAINAILIGQPDAFPADLTLSLSRLRKQDEMQIDIEANADYLDLFEASAKFHWRDEENVSNFLVTLHQNFYSIAFERPANPHAFYAPGVTDSDLENQVFKGNPACYVSEVTYGRVFYLLIQSTASEESVAATLSANLDLGLYGGGGSGGFQYLTDLNNLTIEAYAYGGDQDAVLDSILGGLDSWNAFKASLKGANDVLTAKPISYTVRSIATDVVVKNGFNVDYEYENCSFPDDCVPRLFSPLGQTLDNGCAVDPNPVKWAFEWSPCPYADKYEVQVMRPGHGVFIDTEVTDAKYSYTGTSGFAETANWKWKVRAHAYFQGADEWYAWSSEGTFSIEAQNTDCTTGVQFFDHPNYQGNSWFLHGDVINMEDYDGLDDNIDSLKLFNIKGARLYDDPEYKGAWFHFDHDCPDVEFHSPHTGMYHRNRASSEIIDR